MGLKIESVTTSLRVSGNNFSAIGGIACSAMEGGGHCV